MYQFVFLLTILISYAMPQTTTSPSNIPPSSTTSSSRDNDWMTDLCPIDNSIPCSELPGICYKCAFNMTCQYGSNITVPCEVLSHVKCSGPSNNIYKQSICRFCYQIPLKEQICQKRTHCTIPNAPRSFYETNCTVPATELCMGRRYFRRMLTCNWTSGKSWVTALILSVFLGGFGIDRFYLGMWREGLGKLFSFGGLGVWTLVDVILIAVGYVRPQDGSTYVEFLP